MPAPSFHVGNIVTRKNWHTKTTVLGYRCFRDKTFCDLKKIAYDSSFICVLQDPICDFLGRRWLQFLEPDGALVYIEVSNLELLSDAHLFTAHV